jgi:regulator of replication initiation timing
MARKTAKVRRAIGRVGDDIDAGIKAHLAKIHAQSAVALNRITKKAIRENEKLRAENAKLKVRLEKTLSARKKRAP